MNYFIRTLLKLKVKLKLPHHYGYSDISPQAKRKKIVFGSSKQRDDQEVMDLFNRNNLNIICRCGRSIYDHPVMTIGHHYMSLPYYGDLCPFVQIGEYQD